MFFDKNKKIIFFSSQDSAKCSLSVELAYHSKGVTHEIWLTKKLMGKIGMYSPILSILK